MPVRVKGLSNVTALYAGWSATCAVTASQRVLCWGSNIGDPLATGVDKNEVAVPTAMRGLCA
jgi:alpha-tubulin suppressor-like RCC1 family protein